jgi:hypothetical protein
VAGWQWPLRVLFFPILLRTWESDQAVHVEVKSGKNRYEGAVFVFSQGLCAFTFVDDPSAGPKPVQNHFRNAPMHSQSGQDLLVSACGEGCSCVTAKRRLKVAFWML